MKILNIHFTTALKPFANQIQQIFRIPSNNKKYIVTIPLKINVEMEFSIQGKDSKNLVFMFTDRAKRGFLTLSCEQWNMMIT